MAIDTTVLVVGGGATGAGVARDLAMRGVDITLVEQGTFAGGTSGRSHGLLHSGARYALDDSGGAEECLAENHVLREIAPHCVDETGGYVVQVRGDDADYFDAKREACRDLGMTVETLSGEQARRREPSLADEVERVLSVPDAIVYPSRLTVANAVDAREFGAKLLTGTTVTDLHVEDGRVTGARIEREGSERAIDADHVVNATGAWAGKIGALAGIEIEMTPTKGVMVAVEYGGLDAVLNRSREASDGDIVIPHAGEVILGTTSTDVDDPDDVSADPADVESLFEECGEMLAGLDPERTIRTYRGVRPLYSEDRERYDGRQISRGFYLLDHDERDGIAGITSIVGGKLTTYRLMADAVSDHVCDRLGVETGGRTADEPLVGHDRPGLIDEYVRAFGAANPADETVID